MAFKNFSGGGKLAKVKQTPDVNKATKVFYANSNARGEAPTKVSTPKVNIPKANTPSVESNVGKMKRIKKVKRLDSIRTN